MAHWREAARLEPGNAVILSRLARVLATCPDASIRNGAEAVALAQRAAQLSDRRDPEILDTLAAAYAEAGRFPEAIQTAQEAAALAAAYNNKALSDTIQARIKLYQAGSALRASPRTECKMKNAKCKMQNERGPPGSTPACCVPPAGNPRATIFPFALDPSP